MAKIDWKKAIACEWTHRKRERRKNYETDSIHTFDWNLNHGIFSEYTLFGGFQWAAKSTEFGGIGEHCLKTNVANAANSATKCRSSRYGLAGCSIHGLVIQKGTHLLTSTILATGKSLNQPTKQTNSIKINHVYRRTTSIFNFKRYEVHVQSSKKDSPSANKEITV